MSKSGRIILSLALGGMLGMMVALMVPQIVWWLGSLAGSLIAGFAYALPDIVRQAPRAGRTAWHSLTFTPQITRKTGKIIMEIMKVILFLFGLRPRMSTSQRLMAAIIWSSVIIFYLFLNLFFMENFINNGAKPFLLFFYEVFLMILIFWAVAGSFDARESTTPKKMLAIRKKILFYITPFGTIFLIGLGFTKIILVIMCIGWEFGKFLVKFAKTLFILVHSKELVLVSIDTALGVTAAYLFLVRQGNPVLGAGPTLVLSGFVSVLIGYFLDYQIISRYLLRSKFNVYKA